MRIRTRDGFHEIQWRRLAAHALLGAGMVFGIAASVLIAAVLLLALVVADLLEKPQRRKLP